MDGFKNSTRVQYMKGGSCEGYAKGGKVRGAAKIAKVMGEFKAGTLHSGSKKGPEVTSKKQATAIALSEARKAGAKIPQPVQKKSLGGVLKAMSPAAALASSGVGKDILGSGLMGVGGLLLSQLLKKKQSGAPMTAAEQQQLAQAQSQQAAPAQTAMKKGGKVMKKGNGGSIEADDALMARMTPKELEMGAKGIAAARARLAAPKPARKGVPVDSRKAMIGGAEAADTYMARLPRGAATRAPDRIVPSYKPGTRSGLKGGGLAAMPKGKGCK